MTFKAQKIFEKLDMSRQASKLLAVTSYQDCCNITKLHNSGPGFWTNFTIFFSLFCWFDFDLLKLLKKSKNFEKGKLLAQPSVRLI